MCETLSERYSDNEYREILLLGRKKYLEVYFGLMITAFVAGMLR